MAEKISITEIKVGEQVFQLSELPETVKRLVASYETAVAKLQQTEQELIIANAATRALYSDIVNQISAYAASQESSDSAEVVAVEESAVEEVAAE